MRCLGSRGEALWRSKASSSASSTLRRDGVGPAAQRGGHLRAAAQVGGAGQVEPAVHVGEAAPRPHRRHRRGQAGRGRGGVVDVAGRDDGETVVGGEPGQQAVGLVGGRVRAGRELDSHVVDPEEAGQPVELLAGRGRAVGGQRRAHQPLAAAGQHQPVAAAPLGQLGQVVDRAALLVAAQVCVGHRGGEPVVALDAAGQHQQVVPLGVGHAVLRAAQPQRQLGAVDGPERGGGVGGRGLGQHRRAVEAVVVGDRQAVQPEPDRLLHQLRR